MEKQFLIFILILNSFSGYSQLNVMPSGNIHVGFDSLPEITESIPFLFFDAERASLYGGYNSLSTTIPEAHYSVTFGQDHVVEGSDNIVFGRVNNSYGDLNLISGANNLVFSDNNNVWGNFNGLNEGAILNTVGGQSNSIRNNSQLNTVWGSENTVTGNYNLVLGSRNRVEFPGQYTTVFGYENTVSGTNTTIMGLGNKGIFSDALILGRFNSNEDAVLVNDSLIESSSDPLLIVGNGTEDNNRSNALVLTKNGRLGIGKSKPQAGIDIKEGTLILKEDILIEHITTKQLGINSSIIPTKDDRDLGDSQHKWRNIYATNGVIQTSDIRLKKDITPVADVLDKILQLEPIQYHIIEGDEGHLSTGLSAQAVEKIFPEVVSKTTVAMQDDGITDRYGLRYTELIPIVIKAIQEQQEIINQQQILIDQLISNQNK